MRSIKMKRDVVVIQTSYDEQENQFTTLQIDLETRKSYYSRTLGGRSEQNLNTKKYMNRGNPNYCLRSSAYKKVAILPKELF